MSFSLHGFRTPAPPARRCARGRRESGSAAVEFAIVAPVLLLILAGVFSYGGYFLAAHTVQQLVNDAARAAIAGLDDEERREIAELSVRAGFEAQRFLHGEIAQFEVRRAGAMMTVTLAYDGGDDIFWALRPVAPAPSPLIERSASVRLGGY